MRTPLSSALSLAALVCLSSVSSAQGPAKNPDPVNPVKGDTKGKAQYHQMAPLLDHVSKQLEEAKGKPGGRRGLSTGFRDFDQKTNGLHAGDLVIVAGRPGMGKTSFAMNIAEHAAIVQKVPVAVFSMEMAAEQLVFRVLSSVGEVDQQHLHNADMSDKEFGQC